MRTVDLGWLFDRAHPVPFSGCWLWAGSLAGSGYARFMLNKKMVAAHRVAYELKHGPIPDGLQMDHLCRVRCCINPDHVEPVTASTNVKRGLVPAMLLERNISSEMRQLTAERNRSPEMRAVVSRPKSPEHAAKLRAALVARNQSPEMRAIAKKPKSPEHREAIKAALLARRNKN